MSRPRPFAGRRSRLLQLSLPLLTFRGGERALGIGRPKAEPRRNSVVLRFDPDLSYGYPRRYRRDALGTPMALGLDVQRFTPSPRSERPEG